MSQGDHTEAGERFVRRLIAERRIRLRQARPPVRIPESAVAEYVEARTAEPVRRIRARYGKAA
ncbi:excisionase [Streptomyces sp. NPDC093982]|uniref:excisionase n=1 Tax=Streptomyces sp. NPDC093982 TaxID=3155077 RepID=UPI0034485AA6